MDNHLSPLINDDEYLFRGVIEKFWNFETNRPSSATFKDSGGASVDRDGKRSEEKCIDFMKNKKEFFAICKVKTQNVREVGAIVKYVPIPDNIFHSEIHDSENRPSLRGKKPNKIRDFSTVVYRR